MFIWWAFFLMGFVFKLRSWVGSSFERLVSAVVLVWGSFVGVFWYFVFGFERVRVVFGSSSKCIERRDGCVFEEFVVSRDVIYLFI